MSRTSRLGTPRNIGPEVHALCRKILRKYEPPLFVTVSPEPGASVLDCFAAVADKIARDGGQAVFGWCIWHWPRVLIEGEFHAIWRSPAGEEIDPTPKQDGEEQILFLEDPARRWDEAANEQVANIRLPLRDDPRIHRLISLFEQKHALINRPSAQLGNRKVVIDTWELGAIESEIAMVAASLIEPPGRSDSCPCGSGRKFKRCCGTGH